LTVHDVAVVLLPAHVDAPAITASIQAASEHVPILMMAAPFDATTLQAKISVFVELHGARVREDARREAKYSALQSQFLATLGNELRPSLNAILGWVRMLRDGSIREPQRARALENVERSAQTQLELIEDMLDISRMTSNAMVLELARVDLRRLVDEAVEALQPSARDKEVTLFAAIDGDVAAMSGDAARLQQIVHGLVKNAVSSTPAEGVVTVSLANIGSQVELTVTEARAGGETAVAPPMFENLAIIRHLVELHDGTLRVEAGAPGHRTSVVSLPAAGRLPRNDDEAR